MPVLCHIFTSVARYAYEISLLFTLHIGGSRKSAHRAVLILDHDRPETAVEEEEEDLPNDFEPEEVNRGGSDDEEKVV